MTAQKDYFKKEWTSCFNEKTYFAPDQRTYVFPAGVIHAHAFMSTSASHKSSYDPSWLIVTDWWGIDTFDCTPENGKISINYQLIIIELFVDLINSKIDTLL